MNAGSGILENANAITVPAPAGERTCSWTYVKKS